jgi:hypothetical protein
VKGQRSRLRRARRVVAGGLLAVVILDRRRRQRELPASRGSDPLAAFTDAPCYRENVPPGGSNTG